MKTLIQSVIKLVKDFFAHWNTPADDKYVSSKELVLYSVGGMGVQFLAAINGLITLSASCLLLGSIYAIKPTAFATILLVNTIFTIVSQPLKSWLIDNVKTKTGKIKHWILWLSIPSAVLMTAFAYLPYNSWSANQIAIVVGALFVVMNFIYQFMLGMYNQLPQLMTPNTDERSVIYSVSSIVYSLAPTITGFIFPLIANIFDKGLFDINYYKTIFPIISVAGVLLSLLVYFGTKERVIESKVHTEKVKFFDGMKKILSCKYVWLINIATIFVFARGAIVGVQYWVYTYMLQNNVVYSILTLIVGTASFFGMVLAPILSKKFGKRNTTIFSDLLIAAASVVLIFFNQSVVIMIICLYISFLGQAIQIITLPALNGDMLDYLQWKTGQRLEGMTGNMTILTSLIAIGTNYIIPYVNEYFGLIDNYDVLYDASVREPMFRVLAILAVAGALLHAASYAPWDLTEKRLGEIIEELKERAKKENEEAGIADASILSSGEMLEATAHVGDEGSVDSVDLTENESPIAVTLPVADEAKVEETEQVFDESNKEDKE